MSLDSRIKSGKIMINSDEEDIKPLVNGSVDGDGLSQGSSSYSKFEERRRSSMLDSLDPNRKRKPFHHSNMPAALTESGKVENMADPETVANYSRIKYYSRLMPPADERLRIPDHVLPFYMFSLTSPFGIKKDEQAKQGSIVTIFSIWNTMMGTSLLSMPWAIQQAGFACGIALLVVMAGLALYTCYRVIEAVQSLEQLRPGKILEFSDACRQYLGRWGLYGSVVFSLSALIGAMVVYWVLMTNFLYSSVLFIYGTMSVVFVFVFVIVKAACWGVHFGEEYDVKLFQPTFPALSGILSLGYFIHNCVSSIMRNQRHPENNKRDLTIAYFLVAVTYTFVGVVFYVTFPSSKDCIQDNLLKNFPHKDILAFAARLFLFFQMVSLFPLLMYIMRVQVMHQFFGEIYPSFKHVAVLNLILVSIAILFAVFFPSIGTIIRFSGSFCGLAYVFTLPSLVYLLRLQEMKSLKWYIVGVHVVIMSIGLANFIAQFLLL
ncbi:sodium-coupled neutral amino acid transporter 9-like [Anneissia japonica]|uniref:sodium-coupled neutral amino acid transporter 9-like n=1 Tax=Anneissia japonica TaxID=1529436 RepID=UPI001425967D|nr:sodium-coupled neutral amino acid transporter 9-like [Anneissia japonica]